MKLFVSNIPFLYEIASMVLGIEFSKNHCHPKHLIFGKHAVEKMIKQWKSRNMNTMQLEAHCLEV